MTVTERLPLTRERIATAALAFIDTSGLDALSMRKLGGELGVEAMSLYNHVTNKADLLDAVADTLYGDVVRAYGRPEGDWKDHARALCHAYVDVAAAHPLAVSLLITPPADSAAAREFDARIARAAELMTDDDRIGALAFSTVANWVIGTIVQEYGLIREPGREDESDPAPGAVDHGAGHAPTKLQGAIEQITAEERFDEGLEIVLAGLEARYFPA